MNPEIVKDKSFFNIDKALDTVKRIKSPTQLAAFVLLFIVLLTLYTNNLTSNFLLFFIFSLPFFFIFLLFSDKSIAFFKSYSKTGLRFLWGLILLAFLFGIISLYFVFANPSLINTSPSLPFSKDIAKAKLQEVRNNDNIIQNYTKDYKLLNYLYYSNLNSIISDSGVILSTEKILEVQKKMQEVSVKISNLQGNNSHSLYGVKEIEELTSKLQTSITNLYFSKYIFGIIYSCYSSKTNYGIEDLVDLDRVYFDSIFSLSNVDFDFKNYTDQEWERLHRVRFSEVESKIIRELGKDIIFRKLQDINSNDVQKIKEAFSKMGIIDLSTLNTDNNIILDNFMETLKRYFDPTMLSRRFYELAFLLPQYQFSIYISLYETGLIDFNKFILSMCPVKAQDILKDVLNNQLDLFTSQDAQRLKSLIEKELVGKKSETYSKYILEDAVSKYLNNFSEKNMQLIVKSSKVEEFVVESLKWQCSNLKETKKIHQPFISLNSKIDEFISLSNEPEISGSSPELLNSLNWTLIAIGLIESDLLAVIEES